MTQALGLIEVIGYPPAVEAADVALKAANVKLGGITKVDGGIMTVQIFGDVGAVKAAVEAAGIAAAKVGTLRATHVIPRLDDAVVEILSSRKKVDIKKSRPIVLENVQLERLEEEKALDKTKPERLEEKVIDKILVKNEDIPIVDLEIEKDQVAEPDGIEVSPEGAYIAEETIEETNMDGPINLDANRTEALSLIELKKLSNKELKSRIASLGIKVGAKRLKSAKKDELINIIIQYYKEGET